jgi:hypothetical protein
VLTQYSIGLISMGYSIVRQSDIKIVGVRSKWHFDCYATQLTLVVIVKHIPELDENKIKDDIENAINLSESFDKSFLPLGFQRARAVIPIYLSSNISTDAKTI